MEAETLTLGVKEFITSPKLTEIKQHHEHRIEVRDNIMIERTTKSVGNAQGGWQKEQTIGLNWEQRPQRDSPYRSQ